MAPPDTVDVLVIGAGLSGIGAAVHLQSRCPGHDYLIFEGRDAIGGTWDLFRYPGVRSDSDMYTLGYRFKPWRGARAIAAGPEIRDYIREAATEHGIEDRIRYRHHVTAAEWSSADASWTVSYSHGPDAQQARIRCRFLLLCAGYYRYDRGHTPDFPGIGAFAGRIVHPQQWPDDGIDYRGKRVVVIGSGATAVTLVPALAAQAAHVTMLQRSPTWMVALPSKDALAALLQRFLPRRLAWTLTRWKQVLLGMLVFRFCRRFPERAGRLLQAGVQRALGPGYDIGKDFTPFYRPWEQRLCLVPDGDLFRALRKGTVSVVTDHIERFNPAGIALVSGRQLDADLVVTATGLELQLLGGIVVSVDGRRIEPATAMAYKGLMFSGVPNLASCFGYTNASWTLKADLFSEYVCRLLTHMRRHAIVQCTPRSTDPAMPTEPWVDFSSGYFQRAASLLPRQGRRSPWKLNQNYVSDLLQLRYGRIDDGVLELRRAG